MDSGATEAILNIFKATLDTVPFCGGIFIITKFTQQYDKGLYP